MKKILVLGAGQSTPVLIDYLLDRADEHDWFVTVGDRDLSAAQARLRAHPRSSAIRFDVNDADMRFAHIKHADLVVNMLPPVFQQQIAVDCVYHSSHMVSASYEDIRLSGVDPDANRHGVLILNECGLDPGIDHMSSMDLIGRIRGRGGTVLGFRSYGAGLPAPEFKGNPLRYAITWNPRNIVMSGEAGATYLVDGKTKMVPFHDVFRRTWKVEVSGIGELEAYPNRDSLYYRELYGLERAHTMIRGSLRYPGWCEAWLQIVRLGMPNETMRIPTMPGMTLRDVCEMFLPVSSGEGDLEARLADHLDIDPEGDVMAHLRWLGMFSDEPVPPNLYTVAEVMIERLSTVLRLGPEDRDMVVVMNVVDAEYPDGKSERVTSTMVEYGSPGGETAMAKAVGLPAAAATKLILTGELPLSGCQIPTHAAVYPRILAELAQNGMTFDEQTGPVPA